MKTPRHPRSTFWKATNGGGYWNNAIATLPEAQRIMVVLYHVQGMSYEEIAEITHLPMGTVKSRLNRARLALRDRLGPLAELFEVRDRPK